MSCRGRKPTLQLRPTLLHKSPQAAADRGQTIKFQAGFSDNSWVAEAGNRPFGYDPHSYTSHHRQQLLQKSAKKFVMGCVVSFGQTLEPKRLKICQEMNFLWPFCQWEVVWHMWLSCVRCGILMLDHWNQKMPKQHKKWLVMAFCQVWGKWDLLHTSFTSH